MKKLTALFFCLTMILLAGSTCLAEELSSGDFLYEILENGTARILKFTGETENMTIPSEIDTVPVTSIGDFAFTGCKNITSVTIPSGLTEIGKNPFAGIERLKEINVVSGNPVFEVINNVLFNKSEKKLVAFPIGRTVSLYKIPDGTLAIGSDAFYNYPNTMMVIFPEGLQTIESEAFWGCENLLMEHLPDSLTSIGRGAFAYCKQFKSLIIPEHVVTIGREAFIGCKNLTDITLPKSVESIEIYAFSYISLHDTYTVEKNSYAEKWAIENNRDFIYPDTIKSRDYIYMPLDDGSAKIMKYLGSQKDLMITSTLDEHPVTSIDDHAFTGYEELRSISIPNSVTSIADDAFTKISKQVIFKAPPDSFADEWLKAHKFNSSSANLIKSGEYTYRIREDGTAEITAYKLEYEGIFAPKDVELVVPGKIDGLQVTGIGSNAFRDNYSLSSVVLPEGLTSAGDLVFYGCKNLKKVVLPRSLKSVGDRIFYNCKNLTEIIIDSGNLSFEISDNVLINKEKKELVYYIPLTTDEKTSYTVPDGIQSIGKYAFYNCENLESVVLPDSVLYIGEMAFADSNVLSSITLSKNLISLEGNPFSSCSALTDIKISADNPNYMVKDHVLIQKADMELVAYPIGLTDPVYTIPEGIRTVGDSAFYYCQNLETVRFPDSVISIGPNAFILCRNLNSAELPQNLKSIGENAFMSCRSLKEVSFPDSLASIGGQAFQGTGLLTVTLPDNVEIGINPFGFSNLCEIILSENNPDYYIVDNALIRKENNELVAFLPGNDHETYSVPDGILSIGDFAFLSLSGLKNKTVILPESIESIGTGAFAGYGLSSINLPEKLNFIGRGAFNAEDMIFTVSRNSFGESWVKENGFKYIFSEGSSLAADLTPEDCEYEVLGDNSIKILKYSGDVTDLTIPSQIDGYTVSCIGKSAFSGNKYLTSVTFSEGLETIEPYAFQLCGKLKEITFPASLDQIGMYAFDGISNDAVFNVYPNTKAAKFARLNNYSYINSETSGNYIYEILDDNTANILEYKGHEGEIVVPDSFDGHKVSAINNEYAFKLLYVSKTVILPDGITFIGDKAFAYCITLESLYLPESLDFISSTAFENVNKDIVLTVQKHSYAEKWAIENGYQFIYSEE